MIPVRVVRKGPFRLDVEESDNGEVYTLFTDETVRIFEDKGTLMAAFGDLKNYLHDVEAAVPP